MVVRIQEETRSEDHGKEEITLTSHLNPSIINTLSLPDINFVQLIIIIIIIIYMNNVIRPSYVLTFSISVSSTLYQEYC